VTIDENRFFYRLSKKPHKNKKPLFLFMVQAEKVLSGNTSLADFTVLL